MYETEFDFELLRCCLKHGWMQLDRLWSEIMIFLCIHTWMRVQLKFLKVNFNFQNDFSTKCTDYTVFFEPSTLLNSFGLSFDNLWGAIGGIVTVDEVLVDVLCALRYLNFVTAWTFSSQIDFKTNSCSSCLVLSRLSSRAEMQLSIRSITFFRLMTKRPLSSL